MLNTWDAEVAEEVEMLQVTESLVRRQVPKQLTIVAEQSKRQREM